MPPNQTYPNSKCSRVWKYALYLFYWVAVPCAVLLSGEYLLRALEFGRSTEPFLRKEVEGTSVCVRNRDFFQQFLSYAIATESWEFSELDVIPAKPPGAYRIFVFGESAPEGWPEPAFSFTRFLRTMLRAQYPGVKFEVYNTAFRAVNSHAMRLEAMACARFQPDTFVVYLGNNEVHGPFGLIDSGASRIYPLPLWLIRGIIWSNNLRLAQLPTLFRHEARTVFGQRARGAPPAPVRPDDPRLDRVYDHYRRNLDDICDAAADVGALTLLCTVAVNLRHWRPSDSFHLRGLNGADLAAWGAHVQKGRDRQAAGAWQEALHAYEQAFEIDDTHAELAFRMGECCWRLMDYSRASDLFRLAHELDGFAWVRAKPAINDVVRSVAADRGARGATLVDFEKSVSEHAQHGCPGFDLFLDYCHFNFEGSYLLAKEVFLALEPQLPGWVKQERAGIRGPLEFAECIQRLGLSQTMLLPFFRNTLINDKFYDGDALEEFQRQTAELESIAGADRDNHVMLRLKAAQTAMEFSDPDGVVRLNFYSDVLYRGQPDRYLDDVQKLSVDFPYHRGVLRLLGKYFVLLQRDIEALKTFQRLLALYPDDTASYDHCVEILERQGDTNGALGMLRAALKNDPIEESRLTRQAEILHFEGKPHEAMERLKKAIMLNPHYPKAYAELDEIGISALSQEKRVSMWRELVEQLDRYTGPFIHLGDALEAAGDLNGARDAFLTVLRKDAQDLGTKQKLERIESKLRAAESR